MKNNLLVYIDLLFNLICGITAIMVIAFLYMNPPSVKDKDIESRAEYLLVLEWDDSSDTDIDLWVKLPDTTLVYYGNKESGVVHLERDDLGTANDSYLQTNYVRVNQETVVLRSVVPGKYLVNAFSFTWKEEEPLVVFVSLIQVNPYRVVTKKEHTFTDMGQEKSFFSFRLDEDSVEVFPHESRFVSQGVRNDF